MPQPKPQAITMMRDSTQKKCKKKKKKDLDGRKVHDAYFADTLVEKDDAKKNPIAGFFDSVLSVLPPDAQRNMRHTCRSVGQAVGNFAKSIAKN